MTVSPSRTFWEPLRAPKTPPNNFWALPIRRDRTVASLNGALWLARRAVRHGWAVRRGRGQSSRQFSNFQGNWRVTQQLSGCRCSAALHPEARLSRRSAPIITSKTWINTHILSSKCLWREKLVKLRSKIACCGVDHSYGCGWGGILHNKLKKRWCINHCNLS